MSALGLPIIDDAVQSANLWVNAVNDRVGWENKPRAYRLLRAVFHVLRDHLNVDEAAQLGAQLPTLLRGIYYEGWNPSQTPVKIRTARAFEERLQRDFEPDPLGDTPEAVAAVIAVLRKHISAGEMADVENAFAEEVRVLFG